MIPVIDAAPAASPHPEATARPGIIRRVLGRLKPSGFALTMFPLETPGTQRLSAQEQAAGNIALLMMQRHSLLIEKEILAAERKEAVRRRKKVSDFDRRLRAINHELLSIG